MRGRVGCRRCRGRGRRQGIDIELAEAAANDLHDFGHGLVGLIAGCRDREFAAALGGEHQEFEHALRIDRHTVLGDLDLARVFPGQRRDLRRRSGMQTHLVGQDHAILGVCHA